ncbi:hypothetical protein GOP47_0020262 [Adiantum capillus-veneris]|uniref:Pentatricopeptide repeat-containing protein n=1 Tax=Adiantum capillus-veneris TaxID=13818 RepID=A0A9D4UD57_ADICA|nr:hypothetical protein GOP47_0020262 [Adiantum capillus-veneris]
MYPSLNRSVTTDQSLWRDSFHDASQSRKRESEALIAEPCHRNDGALAHVVAIQDDGSAFVSSLRACTKHKNLHRGTQIHDEILKRGLLEKCSDALVTMYAKCGEIGKAKALLDMYNTRDVITWTSIIAGYARDGHGQSALDCYERMQHEGVPANAVTYVFVLKACSAIGAIDKGKDIHKAAKEKGLLHDNILLGTALVDMYAKCGALSKAQGVLERLPYRDVVSWNALITGYAQKGLGDQALKCFKLMKQEDIPPDSVTYLSLLKACASIGAADRGEQIHDEIVRQGLLKNDLSLGNALVDMYAKCGALSKAQDVLEKLPTRDVVSWSSLICGYAQKRQAKQALECFRRMQHEGIPPDAIAFVCVLNACSHLGLLDEADSLFTDMITRFGVAPNLECYTCMVDLYGRAGHLEKAVQLIQEMPSSDHSALWLALLGACRQWGDVNVGRWAFEQIIAKNKNNVSAYVLMADIYAAAGMLENARYIEAMRITQQQSIGEALV